MKDVMTVIMAGGKGTRLMPLTEDRSKPAVPFGGIYRLIDIPLSNCINSQLYKILIFPQYKSQSLVDHLEEGWDIFSGRSWAIICEWWPLNKEWERNGTEGQPTVFARTFI